MVSVELTLFEQNVLWTVLRLRDKAYGVSIQNELEEKTGKTPSIGKVYTTLDRLQAKGFLTSRIGESTPERGGRAKKYFTITAPGKLALREADAQQLAVKGGLVPAFN